MYEGVMSIVSICYSRIGCNWLYAAEYQRVLAVDCRLARVIAI